MKKTTIAIPENAEFEEILDAIISKIEEAEQEPEVSEELELAQKVFNQHSAFIEAGFSADQATQLMCALLN